MIFREYSPISLHHPYHNLSTDSKVDKVDPIGQLLAHSIVRRLDVAMHESEFEL